MAAKEFTIPIVVPSSPTNGAVAPTVARMPSPRLRSVIVISISRSTARSAELMSPTVTDPSWISGRISVRAPPSTRATCDFLYLSASVTASARLSSSRNCENSGANLRVSACALRRSHHFLMATDSDQIDMMARTNTMPFAKFSAFEHRRVFWLWAVGEHLRRLLDLEFEVRLVGVCRSTDHARACSALHAFAAEVAFVGDRLREIDLGNLDVDPDRRAKNLE